MNSTEIEKHNISEKNMKIQLLEAQIADALQIIDEFWQDYLEGSYDEVTLVKQLRLVLEGGQKQKKQRAEK